MGARSFPQPALPQWDAGTLALAVLNAHAATPHAEHAFAAAHMPAPVTQCYALEIFWKRCRRTFLSCEKENAEQEAGYEQCSRDFWLYGVQ